MKGYTTAGVILRVAFFISQILGGEIMITVNGSKIADADNLKLSDFLKREGYNSIII